MREYTMHEHYHHDPRNKLKHKVTIYGHYKNAHTQMIESWRDREKKKLGIKEKKRNLKEKERKKEENKWINNLKINKTEVRIKK